MTGYCSDCGNTMCLCGEPAVSDALDELAADLATHYAVVLETAERALRDALIGMLPADYVVSDVHAADGSRVLRFADGTTWTVPPPALPPQEDA